MRNRLHNRAAFTLVELLVVLAIIAILASLTSAGIIYYIGRQDENNTAATIEHLYGVLKKQWDFVIAEAKKEPIPDVIRQLTGPDKSGNSPDPSSERARVALIKLRLAEAFPQNFQEISDFTNTKSPRYLYNLLPLSRAKYMPTYASKWAKAGGKTGGNPQIESGACLYMALTTAKGGASIDIDKLPNKPVDMDGDGLPEFGDGWRQSIAFFRFPYNNAALAAVQPNLVNAQGVAYRDPLDPLMKLQSWVNVNDAAPLYTAWNISNRTAFENIIGYEIAFSSPPPFTAPVIVSAGKDSVLDLTFQNATRGFPDMSPISPKANNNIYSFNVIAP